MINNPPGALPEHDEIHIRRAALCDLDKVYACETACFEQPWTFAMLYEDIIENPNTVYLVIERKGKVIGYGGMWIVLDEAHITNICIMPQFRGRGYAKQLIQSLAAACGQFGAESITLEVRVSNKAALRLYKQCGFSIQGLRKKYYKNKEDAYIMWAKRDAIPAGTGEK